MQNTKLPKAYVASQKAKLVKINETLVADLFELDTLKDLGFWEFFKDPEGNTKRITELKAKVAKLQNAYVAISRELIGTPTVDARYVVEVETLYRIVELLEDRLYIVNTSFLGGLLNWFTRKDVKLSDLKLKANYDVLKDIETTRKDLKVKDPQAYAKEFPVGARLYPDTWVKYFNRRVSYNK